MDKYENRIFDEKAFTDMYPHFYKTLRAKCPKLTGRQLKICAMIRSDFYSHEIAFNLKITERGVESHRRRIREKLELHKGELTGFIKAI